MNTPEKNQQEVLVSPVYNVGTLPGSNDLLHEIVGFYKTHVYHVVESSAKVEDLVSGIKEAVPKDRRFLGEDNSIGRDYHDTFIDFLGESMSYSALDLEKLFSKAGVRNLDELEKYGSAELAITRFKDQIVVDLGSGIGTLGYYYAVLAGAKGYIGVDMYYGGRACGYNVENIKEYVGKVIYRFKFEPKFIPSVSVCQDMLTFLQRLPEDSVSILVSGIDGYVIPNDKYRAAVDEEIVRVLNPAGACTFNHCLGFGMAGYDNLEPIEFVGYERSSIHSYKKKKQE